MKTKLINFNLIKKTTDHTNLWLIIIIVNFLLMIPLTSYYLKYQSLQEYPMKLEHSDSFY